ncbi:MAG: efflux RND transporter periplasmic adaptor subunit [Wenzhouxiangellaceae bacterium]
MKNLNHESVPRWHQWTWRSALLLIALGLVGLMAYRVAGLRGANPLPQPPVPAVQIETLREQPLQVFQKYTGTITTRHRFAVAAQVSGSVLKVPKREGERVDRGELLALLDATEFQAEVMRLEASIEGLHADLGYWQTQLSRYQSLFASQAVSQQALDDSERRVRTLQASLKEAQQALRQATTRLAYTEIRAPADGFVQTVYVQPGDLARANAPLIELLDDRSLKVVITLPQADLAMLTIGAPAAVSVVGMGQAIDGQLDRLYPALDTPTRTGTGEVFLLESLPGLRPGMLASVTLRLVHMDAALTVPVHAVHTRQGVSGVFVSEDGIAKWRPVQTGHTVGQRIQIIEGIAPGSRVIVTPDTRLDDGMIVKLVPGGALK